MAFPQTSTPSASKPFSVSSLLSPPEMAKQLDSFRSPPAAAAPATLTPLSSFATSFNPLPTPQSTSISRNGDSNDTDTLPPSPPVSLSEQKENIDDAHEVRDPPLFSQDETASVADFPLFEADQSTREQKEPQKDYLEGVVDEHIKNSALPFHPKHSEYMLAVSFAGAMYMKDKAAWVAREREYLKMYGNKNKVVKRTVSPSKPRPLRTLAPNPQQSIKKQKPVAIPRLPKVARPVRVPRAQRETPKSQVSDSFDLYDAPSPKIKAPTSRDDVDYQSLPDYSPPTSTLPANNPKCMAVEWRVGTIDLSNDPDRHLLHEAELYCASRLRLSCATYLCSKRRIFMARINALKVGKEFRKTDAQQACKIDVNKASKLWTVFDKNGWFDRHWFEQYL